MDQELRTGPDESAPDGLETVAVADIPIWRAATYTVDGDRAWMATMPTVLRAYPQITVDAYWRLTVAEHAALLEAAGGR